MKKSRMIATAVAIALTLGTFQVEAKKSAARKRFDASYDRVKRCFKGDCTRMEGLKAARDLSAAALVAVTAAVAASYAAGKGLERGGRAMQGKKVLIPHPRQQFGAVVKTTGKQMQRPGAAVLRGPATAREGIRERYQTFRRIRTPRGGEEEELIELP